MPGVRAILTADDVPDLNGAEKALTNEPLLRRRTDPGRRGRRRRVTAADAIEAHPRRSRAAALRRRSARQPAARRPERAARTATCGARRVRRRPARRRTPPRRSGDGEVDRRGLRRRRRRPGRLPMGKALEEWSFGDLDAGFKKAELVLDETFVVQSTGHHPMETRSAMAYWQNGKLYLHGSTQSVAVTVGRHRALGRRPSLRRGADLRVHGRRLRQQGRGRGVDGDSGAALEEGQRAGDDAHQPRGGELHRPRAHEHDRPRHGRLRQGRPHHGARSLHRPGLGRVRPDGRPSDPAATPRR